MLKIILVFIILNFVCVCVICFCVVVFLTICSYMWFIWFTVCVCRNCNHFSAELSYVSFFMCNRVFS